MSTADVVPDGPHRSASGRQVGAEGTVGGTPAQLPSGRTGRTFIGRDRELSELLTGLRGAVEGRGRLFVLMGEPGIGKTRTTGEVASAAEAQGVRTYWGRCYEAGGAPAFWPWVQVVRGLIRDIDDEEWTAHLGSIGGDVALLAPELRERVPGLPAPTPFTESDQARFRLFDAVATFLESASRARPLALLLDDMHAADEASLRLLQFLAQQLHDQQIFVVATFRDLDLGRQHPVSRTLADLEREPTCRRMLLERLTAGEVKRFIEATSGVEASDPLVRTVMESTEGNPFFVVEVVRLLVGEGKLHKASEMDTWTVAVPRGVRDVVGRRLDLLSDDTNRALDAASVIGREFATAVLERLLDVSREELVDALEDARAARIIDAMPDPGTYRFSHALIRDVLYDELTPIRRLRLHREVGEALEELSKKDREPPLTELAYHFLAAATDGGAERAVTYARRAGDHAMAVLAYEEAARAYEQALDALEFTLSSDEQERGELLVRLGDARAASGEADGSRDAYLRAAALARRLDTPTVLARAALGFAGSWTAYDRDVRDVELLREALGRLAGSDDVLRSRLLARIAADPDFPPSAERRAMADEAVAVARATGDLAALAFALKAKHGVIDSPESTEECLSVATEMVSVAESRDKEMVLLGRSLEASNLLILGDVRAAERVMDAHGLLAKELRQPLHLWLQALFHAGRALSDGRFEEGERLAERALEIGSGTEATDVPEHYAIQLMIIRRELGGLDELVPLARQWVDERPQVPAWRAALAALLCEVGRYADARRELERLSPIEHAMPWDGQWLPGIASIAWACAAVGDEERAKIAYDMLLPYADRTVICAIFAVSFGPVSHYLGLLARTLGRHEQARRHFIDSLEASERAGSRAWHAWTQYEYARLLLRSADDDVRAEGRGLLEACAKATADLGMTRLSANVADLASSSRVAPSSRLSARPGATLTPRELEVLRLIARGHSNREIARALFASEKTVRNHVSSVLAKLNVADRTQAALYAVREGLAELERPS
jgi:DNA-binding CsgD family transcriptional regulator/tetratricopeptide (TPR) repeat protein